MTGAEMTVAGMATIEIEEGDMVMIEIEGEDTTIGDTTTIAGEGMAATIIGVVKGLGMIAVIGSAVAAAIGTTAAADVSTMQGAKSGS